MQGLLSRGPQRRQDLLGLRPSTGSAGDAHPPSPHLRGSPEQLLTNCRHNRRPLGADRGL